MAGLTYLLDTNVFSDRINGIQAVTQKLNDAILAGDRVYLCQPVYYEVLRGLIRARATQKRRIFEEVLMPAIEWVELTDEDWRLAAQYWADTISRGKQLSDVDLLIAGVATRLDATIVSSDDDFDAVPVRRVNWRET